jgi:hypothetical protein
MVLRPPSPPLAELHNQPVIVATDAGLPVSVGRLIVTQAPVSAAVIRVDLEFETERLKCALRISAEKWHTLLENWDGDKTRYVLPHGDGFWLDEREKNKSRVLREFLRHGDTSEYKNRLGRKGPPR